MPVPEQSPDQPANFEPAFAAAVRVTAAPYVNWAEHTAPQSSPAGELVTEHEWLCGAALAYTALTVVVEVGATHRAEGDFDQRVGPIRHRWLGNLADLDVALALKGQSLHGVSPEGTCTCFASPLASAKLQTSRSGPSTPRALSTDRTCVRWSSA